MSKGNKAPRTEKQMEKWQEYKNNQVQVGKSAEQKQIEAEMILSNRNSVLNLANVDTSRFQNITKGV
jgi:hypothetical protein